MSCRSGGISLPTHPGDHSQLSLAQLLSRRKGNLPKDKSQCQKNSNWPHRNAAKSQNRGALPSGWPTSWAVGLLACLPLSACDSHGRFSTTIQTKAALSQHHLARTNRPVERQGPLALPFRPFARRGEGSTKHPPGLREAPRRWWWWYLPFSSLDSSFMTSTSRSPSRSMGVRNSIPTSLLTPDRISSADRSRLTRSDHHWNRKKRAPAPSAPRPSWPLGRRAMRHDSHDVADQTETNRVELALALGAGGDGRRRGGRPLRGRRRPGREARLGQGRDLGRLLRGRLGCGQVRGGLGRLGGGNLRGQKVLDPLLLLESQEALVGARRQNGQNGLKGTKSESWLCD